MWIGRFSAVRSLALGELAHGGSEIDGHRRHDGDGQDCRRHRERAADEAERLVAAQPVEQIHSITTTSAPASTDAPSCT